MGYFDSVSVFRPSVCDQCYCVVHPDDQERHDQAVHGDKTTIYNGAGDIVATYPDDWRDPVIADKNTCYHPTPEQLEQERKAIHEAMTEQFDLIHKGTRPEGT